MIYVHLYKSVKISKNQIPFNDPKCGLRIPAIHGAKTTKNHTPFARLTQCARGV